MPVLFVYYVYDNPTYEVANKLICILYLVSCILRWMSGGVTKLDRIYRNERIRGATKVGEISKKVQESRWLKWYGHVLRKEDEYVGKGVMGMEVPGKRRRGRPKRRWMDTIGNDLSEKFFIKGGHARPCSMEASHKTHRPHIKVGKDEEKKKEEEDSGTSFLIFTIRTYITIMNKNGLNTDP